MQPNPIRVSIIDDHLIFAEGLKLLIEKIDNIKVDGLFDHGHFFLELLKQDKIKPQYAFIDINMPGVDGFEIASKALEIMPSLKIIVMTMFDDGWSVKQMMDLHVSGYITKDTNPKETLTAIRRIFDGECYITEKAAVNYAKQNMIGTGSLIDIEKTKVTENVLINFSETELSIIKLIAQGNSDKKIGIKIHRSPRTIGWHKSNIMRKIGATKTIEIVAYAYQAKLA
jgi:DNA-binding NarL/FixJ family response regulator